MENKVYICDFEFLMEFKKNKDHIKKYHKGFEGTPFYASIKSLAGFTKSRRDDLESLGYTFLHILDPTFTYTPWAQI